MFSACLFADFSIRWTGEKSGIISYDADKYSDTAYEIGFDDQQFIPEELIVIGWGDGGTIKENFGSINEACKNDAIVRFAMKLRVLAVSRKYFLPDAKVLLNKGYLTEGKDYIIDEKGVAKVIGTTNFVLEHAPGNYRSTQINNIVLDTDWSTGKQQIRVLLE